MEILKDYEKVHIRTGGNLLHCSVEMLPEGKDIPYIVIEKFTRAKNEKTGTTVKEDCILAHFAKNPYTTLPWMLNYKNKKTLCKLAGVDEWGLLGVVNLPVTITRENTSMGWGLRASSIPAKDPNQAKPVLTSQHENWKKVLEYVQKGGAVADIKAKYEVSAEVEKELIEVSKK